MWSSRGGISFSQKRTRSKAGGASAVASTTGEGDEGHDELAPFQHLGGVLHHTIARAAGVAAAVGLELTSTVSVCPTHTRGGVRRAGTLKQHWRMPSPRTGPSQG
jgi:hypothetical protein